MKYHFGICLLLVFNHLFSQEKSFQSENYHTAYEQQVLQNDQASHLELLMSIGAGASKDRTLAAKAKIDAFVNEIKVSNLMRLSETKLMKELHKRVHARFLDHYQIIAPFHEIFETGQYNCVSSTALFALILEELNIPYNIQEQPTHVYIMAYPDTKAISVEMTALKDAYYLPARRDVSQAVSILLELKLTTEREVTQRGALSVYNEFFNTNGVVNLRQLTGIQYFNESIRYVNADNYSEAFKAICKAEFNYSERKTELLKMELLTRLLGQATFKSLRDLEYLVGYASLRQNDYTNIRGYYAEFIHEQLTIAGRRELADSSHVLIAQRLKDTILVSQLNGLYYLGLSEYFSNAYNPKKRLEYAELANKSFPDIPGIQLWLIQSILSNCNKYEGEELLEIIESYAARYPFIRTHNLSRTAYFYAYTEMSNDFYSKNEGKEGKKYFDLAVQTMDAMDDKDVLDPNMVGWLYAEAGTYLLRQHEYQAALKMLEDGLALSPEHERLIARIKIVRSKMK